MSGCQGSHVSMGFSSSAPSHRTTTCISWAPVMGDHRALQTYPVNFRAAELRVGTAGRGEQQSLTSKSMVSTNKQQENIDFLKKNQTRLAVAFAQARLRPASSAAHLLRNLQFS